MKIKFTEHAIKRCKEQGIELGRIYKDFKRAPLINGRWVTKYAIIHFRIDGDSLVVVTVIAKKKYNKRKKVAYWKPKSDEEKRTEQNKE